MLQSSFSRSYSFIEYLKKCIDELLATYDNRDVSGSVLLEAFKSVMRGHTISFDSSKKRELNNQQRDI